MTINVKDDTKSRWDKLKPDDETHDEFAQSVLDAYESGDDAVIIDGEDIQEHLELFGGTVELASYRGAKEAIENHR